MIIKCDKCILRKWKHSDLENLVENANNYNVASTLRDAFPYPYTIEDGEEWIEFAGNEDWGYNFAITINDEAVGGIGLIIGKDIERKSSEVGYWLGEDHWGKGIVSSALEGIVKFAFNELKPSKFKNFGAFTISDCDVPKSKILRTSKIYDFRPLERIFAVPLEHNIASRRVLEKNNFVLEGILRNSVVKYNKVYNQALYARIREDI